MYALVNGIVHTGWETRGDRALLIDGMYLRDVLPLQQLPAEVPTVDLKGCHVAPGFIDLQLNGCGGVMFNDTMTAATLDTMHRTNLRSGTTSFLPTLITTCDADMKMALELVAEYRHRHPDAVLGLHLEGPYLNPKRKGIHNEANIRQPDRPMLETIARAGRETVRLVTLAPERVEAAAIRCLTEAGIVVSAGHTDATYEEAIAGFAAGIRMATHLFNAMSPWLGRSPGMVGAVFNHPEVYAGIIADGHHTHWQSIHLAHRLKGNRLLLVTDATPPAGTTMASFWIGGQEVFYQDGKCVSADGTLGGSALTMIEAIANCVHHGSIPLDEALRMASTYPATVLSLDQQLGYLAPGYRANLTVFDDQFRVRATCDRGQLQVQEESGFTLQPPENLTQPQGLLST